MKLISNDSIDLVYTSVYNLLSSLFPSGTPATLKSDENVLKIQKYNNMLEVEISSGAILTVEQMAAHKLLTTICDYRIYTSKIKSYVSKVESLEFKISMLEDNIKYYSENKDRFSADSPIHNKNYHSELIECQKEHTNNSFSLGKLLNSDICTRFPAECLQYFEYVNIKPIKLYEIELKIRSDDLKKYLSRLDRLERAISDGNSGRRERQLKKILSTIAFLKYTPMQIPLGGKEKIKNECIKLDPSLFTPSGFDHAWKVGLERKMFRLNDHNKFSSK